jgi:small-conductance mechanosensitive channel
LRLPSAAEVLAWAEEGTGAAIAAGIALGVAFLVHFALFAVLDRIARLSPTESDDVVVDRVRQPVRWSLAAIMISLAAESQPVLAEIWDAIARFVVPALLGWVALSLVKAFATIMTSRAVLSNDELAMRSRQTRVAILSRSLSFVIIFVTVALMLLGIPGVRNVGVTLMASAGVATLAVGAAAQPALKSLIAGIQMALTEPIRIGDLVVIDNETGRVEDIRMTYVVIRTPDDRRLLVPTAKFLDTTFQNWTRVAGGITGTVVMPIAAGHAIAPIRAAFERLLAERPEWDQRAGALQVSEVRVDSVELKMVMSARDPGEMARLRFAMREAMLEWLRTEMPEALKK